eukprot:scaffold285_cov330-Pavlova_lutheri.AAC.7
MEVAAAMLICIMFTTSLVNHSYLSCTVAPMMLSNQFAKPAHRPQIKASWPRSCPCADAMAPMPVAAAKPPNVPSKLMAPSVPLGTFSSVVLRKVVFPKAFPTSLEVVSASLLAMLVT